MLAPLGVAAAPLIGDRVPVGAGVRLERGAGFLIVPQLAAVFRDRLRRYGLRPRVSDRGRQRAGIDGAGLRRDQQQREREVARTRANRMRWHPSVVASVTR